TARIDGEDVMARANISANSSDPILLGGAAASPSPAGGGSTAEGGRGGVTGVPLRAHPAPLASLATLPLQGRVGVRGAVIAISKARVCAALMLVTAFTLASTAHAADRIRLAVQRTGTLAWELDVIKAHGLDRKAGLTIETTELASTEAGKIALKGGSADL